MDSNITSNGNIINIIKTIIKTVIFILIGFMLFTWITYLYRPNNDVRRGIIGFYGEPENSLDIVFIGTSTTLTYWIPMQAWNDYGITSYDFASTNMPPQVMKYYLIEMLKTQRPDLVMIDLRPFQYGDTLSVEAIEQGVHYSSDAFNFSLNRNEMIRNSIPDTSDPLPFYFDIATYHNNDDKISAEQWVMSLNKFHYITKGFLFKKAHSPVERVDVKDIEERLPISEDMERLLTEVMDFCESENIPVIFFVPPYSMMQRSETPDFNSTDEQKMYNYMEDLITSRGFDFINCNDYYDEIGLDFSHDFYDWAHVNVFGAEKFTKFMSDYILKKYQFEDKRNNPEYNQWNIDLPLFQEEMENTKAAVQWIYENPNYDYGNG